MDEIGPLQLLAIGFADPQLDGGKTESEEPGHTAERHDHREGDGEHPDCGCAQLRAPDAHGHHREHVVESRDRVEETGDEARGRASLVGRQREWREGEREQESRDESHHTHPMRIAVR